MKINDSQVNQVLYINLGRKNEWQKDCIYKDNTLRLSYKQISHQLCIDKRWSAVEEQLKIFRSGKPKGVATNDLKQIRYFYLNGEDTLWITFFEDKLWWCFSKAQVTQPRDTTYKERPVKGKWCCLNLQQQPLEASGIDTSLLKIGKHFQGTICRVNLDEYVIQLINGSQKRKIDILQYENQILEDFQDLINETEEVRVTRIKRYKKIIDKLKDKYNNQCQFENCKFTFQKADGSFYSEGHHLIQLSKEGSQEADNVIIVCPNHHRMLHYANTELGNLIEKNKRLIKINGEDFYILYIN
ncbi:HNH endonuclease [Nostoc sp.]|uniref:HNH endonuclease n=1 Tax=Nostoc sp. TaxID=1180 RepID=UPI002FF6E912